MERGSFVELKGEARGQRTSRGGKACGDGRCTPAAIGKRGSCHRGRKVERNVLKTPRYVELLVVMVINITTYKH